MHPYQRQFPIQIPGFPPFGPPGSGGSPVQGGPPSSPPPDVIPSAQAQGQFGVYAVDPGAISGCLFRFTYIRLDNGRAFWFFPTFVGRRSVAGYRWRRRQYRWDYFGIDLERIRSFSCS